MGVCFKSHYPVHGCKVFDFELLGGQVDSKMRKTYNLDTDLICVEGSVYALLEVFLDSGCFKPRL